jgi:hypothetical protein
MTDLVREEFLDAAGQWSCPGYFFDIRYLALKSGGKEQLCGAIMVLNPLPPKEDLQFSLDTENVRAGQIQCQAPADVLKLLELACTGRLSFREVDVCLPIGEGVDYYSDSGDQSKATPDVHLRVLANQKIPFSPEELRAVDTALRRTHPPFDGLVDLASWLGVQNPAHFGSQASIDIRLNPPVDVGDELVLADDMLSVNFRALEALDPAPLKVAVRVAPGKGLSRHQLSDQISWSRPVNGLKEGKLRFNASNADVAQLMLSLGGYTIRRQVLVDKSRARTLKLAAVMALDPGLDQLTTALRSTSRDRDAARFEKAVATLLFLYGFIPTPHVDTDGPDLLVSTPGGRLAIVECTLKVSDFYGKVSKLAGRRSRILAELAAKGHAADVHAVLVCASPRSDIVGIDNIELAKQNVTLITGENLQRAIDEVQSSHDPDELLIRASAALVETQRQLQPLGG